VYSLEEIWTQAIGDASAVRQRVPKGELIIGSGVRIQRFGDRIEMLNMNKGGDYYKILDEDEYNIFYHCGWKRGSVNLSISNCLFKLGLIEDKIKTEVNTRKNDKHIQNLKNRRENILNKYTKLKQKLNQLN
tara:strand:+ start:2088 stop:2483 length:396 start_codon:yes stop_codon:yes gene_type:complete